MSVAVPLRLVPCFPASILAEDVAARGGRCFVVRHAGVPADGELMVAIPGVAGVRQVLVPRGLGRPLIGRPAANGWIVEGSGEACSARRWLAVGGLAARVRPVGLPKGPAVAVAPLRRGGPAAGAWLAVRVVNPALTAWSLADASVRNGAVAVVGPRVIEVSAAARASGVALGMSARLAVRKCPGLRILPPPERNLLEAARVLLEAEVGDTQRQRGALFVRLSATSVAELFAFAEQVALRLWQELGLRARLAVAAEAGAAVRITRLLEADSMALVPATASAAWRRRGGPSRPGIGVGPSLVDIEGIVAKARALVERAPGPGALRVDAGGRAIELRLGSASAVGQVENALRAQALQLGEVRAMAWTGAGPARQLPLLASGYGK